MSPEMLEALSLGIATLGASAAVVPWLSPKRTPARAFMAVVTLGLLIRYLLWRVHATLPEPGWTLDFAVGLLFLTAETASLMSIALSLVFLSRTSNRSSEVEANKSWLSGRPAPLVDVFICTYNEEEAILERTMIGATGLDYSNYRVWLLDDGRRPWARKLAERLGCRYLSRSDNRHAKAGNINNAMQHVARLPDRPGFIALLDADFVPMANFLSRTMPLFQDRTVGVVQTPQHFINPDPIQTNLAASHVLPDEQRYFFDVVLASRDAWGTAFCCGTSAVIRFEPLMAIGGFPTDSVTEDYLLTLRLKEAGYSTAYLNERLTLGLAPEGLEEFITQRGRWCLGCMQIVRGRSGPFSPSSGLGFIDRLSVFDSFLSWAAVYPTKMLGLAVPSLFFLFGIKAVDAGLAELLGYFLPFFLWHAVTMAWISGGRAMTIISDVAQLIAAPAVVRAVFAGLIRPNGHKFRVTAKGGDRSRGFIQWRLLRIYSVLVLMTLTGIAHAFVLNVQGEALAFGGLALAWSWYNAVILIIVCFVCIEQPRRRKAERLPAASAIDLEIHGQKRSYRLLDISITGARVRGQPPVPAGGHVACTLNGRSSEARIVRALPGSFAIEFDTAFPARIAMIRSFYSGNYARAIEDVAAARVGRAILARLLG